MVPRSEKHTVAYSMNLLLMEKLSDIKEINIPAIMLEHMDRVITWKKANCRILYGYLLIWVFQKFEVSLVMGVPGTVKHMFSKSTLRYYECIEGETPGRLEVGAVLEKQDFIKREVDYLSVFLAAKKFEVATLK